MAAPDLSFIQPDVSLDEMRPVDRRRLAAMMNAVLMKIGRLLGETAKRGEEALLKAEARLDKVETAMRLLEAKLQHINLEGDIVQQQPTTMATPVANVADTPSPQPTMDEVRKDEEERQVIVVEEKEEEKKEMNGMKMRDDPRYTKYFKMVKMGIQEEAVRIKMRSEGVEPSILDTPDAISDLPPPIEESGSSSDSVASFSDSD